MLAEHRIYNANEGLIAVEHPVSSGEQITLQPTLALVFTEHRIQHESGGREEFIILYRSGVPLTIGYFKDRPKEIRERLIRTEDPEISLILIQFDHVTEVLAQHKRILTVNGSGRRHIHRVNPEIWHVQIAQQNPAVGVGI